MRCGRSLLVLLLASCVAGCGESEAGGLFTKEQARARAAEFIDAWASGDPGAVQKLCGENVRFEGAGRRWSSPEEIARNLKNQMIRYKDKAAGISDYEVFTYHDLKRGRWPRNRQVSEDRRDREILDLGIEVDGFLVRASRKSTRGWRLVLNPRSQSELEVVSIFP